MESSRCPWMRKCSPLSSKYWRSCCTHVSNWTLTMLVSSATNLATREQQGLRRAAEVLRSINAEVSPETQALYDALARTYVPSFCCVLIWLDRKSVVLGKSASVRVVLGGRWIIKKKRCMNEH